MPLTVALDMAKRLHHELAKKMTPEQRRDFTRIEKLIAEAQEKHQEEVKKLKENGGGGGGPSGKSSGPSGRRRSFWSR